MCPVNLVRTYQLQASVSITMLDRGIFSTLSATNSRIGASKARERLSEKHQPSLRLGNCLYLLFATMPVNGGAAGDNMRELLVMHFGDRCGLPLL